jgi:hypothetical protein
MLVRQNGDPFSLGRSQYADRADASHEQTPKIFVKISAEPLGGVIFAQLDTGAAWSVLNAEIAEAMSLLDGHGEPKGMQTRLGEFQGRLERTSFELIADEGTSLTIEATVWVSRDWPGGTFLGYGGLLDHLRFAIDPTNNSFHFGQIIE